MFEHYQVIEPPTLAAVFPTWNLDRRDLAWLWWQLRKEMQLTQDDFTKASMPFRIAKRLSPERIDALITKKQNQMLPADRLPKVEHSPRALQWMIDEVRRSPNSPPAHEMPSQLSQWETLVLLIDVADAGPSSKQLDIFTLEKSCIRHLQEDRHFRWLWSTEERARCEAAWTWYRDYRELQPSLHPFQNYAEVASYWDSKNWRLDERRHHLEQIQKHWKTQRTKKDQVGKKQTNLLLSEDAKAALDQLAADSGVTKKEVIERLLREEMARHRARMKSL